MEFSEFENIPNALFEYLANCVKNNRSDRFTNAMFDDDHRAILTNIDNMFLKASKACDLSTEQLTKKLRFNSKDLGTGRIESFFCRNTCNQWAYSVWI